MVDKPADIYSKELLKNFSDGNYLAVIKDFFLLVWTFFPPFITKPISDFVGFIINLFSYLPYLYLLVVFVLGLLAIRLILRLKKIFNEESVLLEITPPAYIDKSAYTTQRLFEILHQELNWDRSWMDKLLGRKLKLSFEIVSSLHTGIRYLVRTTPNEAPNVKKHLTSFMSSLKIKEVEDYIEKKKGLRKKVLEFGLKKHFAYPLQKLDMFIEHDPIAFLTGMMTKLSPDELISFQIVISPTKTNETNKINNMILGNENVLKYLDRIRYPAFLIPITFTISILIKMCLEIGKQVEWFLNSIAHSKARPSYAASPDYQFQQNQFQYQMQLRPARVITPFEEETVKSIKEKIDQPLFETSLRLLAIVSDKKSLNQRTKGFTSTMTSFSVPKYQSIIVKNNIPLIYDLVFGKLKMLNFQKRLLSLVSDNGSSLLSASEVSSFYHFPFTRTTQTENIVKSYSDDLSAPLSLKQGRDLAVVFGVNRYGGDETPIGLTEEERKTHAYIIGRTGGGKTTLMSSMAIQDILKGEGLAFIDPDGDVSELLVSSIPKERINDFVYFNPRDMDNPIGINLLELTPGLSENEADLEKEVVAEGVISLFRKVFSKDERIEAHRIEYILRNAIHTAFTIPDRTIFTVYKLLNNPTYLKSVIKTLEDPDLLDFWKNEFGRAGDYQIVKMVGGVTAKIGRFLFSPIAKRILEQPKSTINFNEILNGKILICNLSAGKLGEDTSKLLGTTILTKIQQAALRRAEIPEEDRKQFHLYVDEFQDFATLSFAKMLSRVRKYGMDICMAEQSTAQQSDDNIVSTILANVTTLISFKTGNPEDEELMLAQFAPAVKMGQIMNLPRYKFYIKVSATDAEAAFSGETIKIKIDKDLELIKKLIDSSRKNYAIKYVRAQKKVEVKEENTKPANDKLDKNTTNTTPKGGLPKKNR
ncbi:hypothetical protein A3C59_04445 [Candidatus Daviesbacteria bacterium RIFCSPHIGHO2_02_FULL_36_13]|uniref:Uncharacterized protein n=1 Tax=Candidatus Daviesbacteria bacterium RIFCSPHIGHO2_02_FULL_36_13 TaxID=1797768 RepID=A0A1F5JW77_9BACT|nr:MAG: hypothetical protein A3C59_04445 [Candidatus Daviesbacteria bacterium RIFCSPHIGHO2_02_FULL_36_13]OGE43274.1 MAG: hypothetical protein A3A45_03095 [Candidatus Daviesbacteria bacterium RIFCSPLOWO2_01_FULL_36_8]